MEMTTPFRIPTWTPADRLIKAREDRQLTQPQLADLSHVSARTIARYEAGGRMGYNYAKALAEALEVPLEWLLEGTVPTGALTARSSHQRRARAKRPPTRSDRRTPSTRRAA